MYRHLLRSIMICGLIAAVLYADPFWASKPYKEWTAKEVEKILGDSPGCAVRKSPSIPRARRVECGWAVPGEAWGARGVRWAGLQAKVSEVRLAWEAAPAPWHHRKSM